MTQEQDAGRAGPDTAPGAMTRHEQMLRLSEQRFRVLADVAAQVVWTASGSGEVIEDSPSWRAFTGQTYEQYRGAGWLDALHPDDRSRTAALWADAVAGCQALETEYRLRNRDGKWHWTSVRAFPVLDADGRVCEWIGMNTDITGLKHSGEQFRLAIEAAPTGMLMVDRAGRIVMVNAEIEKLFGYTRDELIGAPVEQLIPAQFRSHHPDYRNGFFASPSTRRMGGGRDLYGLRKDGSEVPVEIGLNPLRTPDGDFVLSSVADITARKREESERDQLLARLRVLNGDLEERTRELSGTLREREVLLQEVHHRVKNNLQVVSSLINMQVRKLEDGASRSSLQECQTRVQAIALIHEKLYQSSDYARVPFSDYARSLASNIFHATGVSPDSIELELVIDDLELPVDKAIPCGLLLNELITNALKHGFSEGRSGTIRVELGPCGNGRLALAVIDNGVGLPPDLDLRNSDSLGLQLVGTLVEQLDAQLQIQSTAGASFRITFPAGG